MRPRSDQSGAMYASVPETVTNTTLFSAKCYYNLFKFIDDEIRVMPIVKLSMFKSV